LVGSCSLMAALNEDLHPRLIGEVAFIDKN
jgi:hypothetical protein